MTGGSQSHDVGHVKREDGKLGDCHSGCVLQIVELTGSERVASPLPVTRSGSA
jgi:hypothetical protein